MSDDDNWSPEADDSMADDDEEYDPNKDAKSKAKSARSTRRNSKSKNSKKKSIEDDDGDDDSPLLRRSKRRSSSSNNKKPRRNSSTSSKSKKKAPVLCLDSSTDDENAAIVANKSKQNSKIQPIEPKTNGDAEPATKNGKKKGKKRTSTEAKLENPPAKKARTSSNSSTSSSSKKSKKSPKSFSSSSTTTSKKNGDDNTSNSNKSKKKGKESKATKKKKSSKNDPTERICQFMMDANRPYSASALKPELKDEIGAAQIKKSLAALEKDGVLAMREFGKKTKTQIYWRNQDSFDEGKDDEEDDAVIQQRIKELELTIRHKRDALKALKAETNALKKTPNDEDIEKEMNVSTTKYHLLDQKVKAIESGDVPRVSKEDLEAKLIEFHRFAKAWKERRAVVYDMISKVFEDSKDKPSKIISNKLNGETDKENDVDWSKYKQMYVDSGRAVQKHKDAQRKK